MGSRIGVSLLLLIQAVSPGVSSPSACGVPVVSSRIVGGEDAVDGEWPWQVVVNYNNNFICGGSLISEQWVLSAAHCFKYPSIPSYYTISLGIYRLGGSNPHGFTVEVEQIIKNPLYTNTGDRGDITLVKLKNPVAFNDYILPICLPAASVSFPSGMECWVTGWGTRRYGGSVPNPNILQKVMTPLIDYKQCDQMYHASSSVSSVITIIQEEKICSGYTEGGKDSCQGDSGGPLVCKVEGVWLEAGIVSWGNGCALPGYPGVYTLVPAYESWIKMYIPGMTFSSSSTTLTTAVPVSLTVPPKTTWSTTIRTSSRVCGSPAIFSRIVGGTDAVDGEWPWQVVLYVGGTFICGGSLISEQWVLSAAHCFDYSSYPSYYTISLGMYRLGGSNPHGVTVEVEQIIKNSQYTYTGGRGDIALVKLKIPVAFNDYIHPICLPAASISFLSGMECWVTGWGTRSSGVSSDMSCDPSGSISSLNTLQKVMTPLIDYKQCDQMYHIGSSISTDITIILEENICSGYKEGGKDSCQGDSGGPLVCKVNGTWFQAGVVSWGDGCALANRPGVYTLVPAYESWIKTNVPELLFHNVIPESTNPPDSPEGSASRYCTSWTLVLFSVLSLTLF